MKLDKLLAEIKETNVAYLSLAQQIIREDKAEAIRYLGISEKIADTIESLTQPQIQKVASCNLLLCRFSFNDRIIWELITNHGKAQAFDKQNSADLANDPSVSSL